MLGETGCCFCVLNVIGLLLTIYGNEDSRYRSNDNHHHHHHHHHHHRRNIRTSKPKRWINFEFCSLRKAIRSFFLQSNKPTKQPQASHLRRSMSAPPSLQVTTLEAVSCSISQDFIGNEILDFQDEGYPVFLFFFWEISSLSKRPMEIVWCQVTPWWLNGSTTVS